MGQFTHLDGEPDCSHIYLNYFIPYVIGSPLVSDISACMLKLYIIGICLYLFFSLRFYPSIWLCSLSATYNIFRIRWFDLHGLADLATCFGSEYGQVDQHTKIVAKGRAIHSLNAMLRSDVYSTSDEAIAGVVKLVNNDLCFGETQHLRVHLQGLRKMIQLRGGVPKLGMNGILSTNVML